MDDRRILNGIFWGLRSGAPWRDLPHSYGPPTTCYNRFVRWRRAGVWDRLVDALAAAHDAAVQMIDTTIVHQHGACVANNSGQHIGRSRGGLTSTRFMSLWTATVCRCSSASPVVRRTGDGFPSHRPVPPKRNPKPRPHPRVRGLFLSARWWCPSGYRSRRGGRCFDCMSGKSDGSLDVRCRGEATFLIRA